MRITIGELVTRAGNNAISKGFRRGDRTFGDIVALIHTEVSEAFEEFRNGSLPNDTRYVDNKPEGIPIELADIVIRVADLCHEYNIDLEAAIAIKMGYNETRPYMHGGKQL